MDNAPGATNVELPDRPAAAPASSTEKEARLARIIEKLEVKTKRVWNENKELSRRLELAQIDCEIAQELAESLKDELKEVQNRVRELEELKDVNSELEASYMADIERLELECQSLRKKFEVSNLDTQKFESLQLDLAEAQRKVKLADLELRIIKDGVAAALGPLLGPEEQEWLPIVDLLSVSIDPIFDKYKQGQISVLKMGELLAEHLDKCLDLPQTYEAVDPSTEVPDSDSPKWRTVKAELARRREKLAELSANSDHGSYDKGGLGCDSQHKISGEALQHMRISVLEAKLLKAQNMAEELQLLREKQLESKHRHSELLEDIANLKEELAHREQVINSMQRKNLPYELITVKHQMHISYLAGVIKQLSSNRPKIHLDELFLQEPMQPISRLARNERVRKLRHLAFAFRLGKTPEEAQSLAIEQQTRLMLL